MTTPLVQAIARRVCPLICGSQEDEWGNDLPDVQFDDISPGWQVRHLEYAQAALTAITEAGYAVVPVEPTDAMVRAADMIADEYYFATQDEADSHAAKIFRDMISATNTGKGGE